MSAMPESVEAEARPLKLQPWNVWDRFGRHLGVVRAALKGHALFLAERDLKAPAGFYVGRADR